MKQGKVHTDIFGRVIVGKDNKPLITDHRKTGSLTTHTTIKDGPLRIFRMKGK